MYKIRTNDGDCWFKDSIEEAITFLKECLEGDTKEFETLIHNSYEIHWVENSKEV